MNDLVLRDTAIGLITPYPTLVPLDVMRYGTAAAQDGLAFVQWNTGPLPYLPHLITIDPKSVVDAGRAFYIAGYTTSLPVADVDAQLGYEAARISAGSSG